MIVLMSMVRQALSFKPGSLSGDVGVRMQFQAAARHASGRRLHSHKLCSTAGRRRRIVRQRRSRRPAGDVRSALDEPIRSGLKCRRLPPRPGSADPPPTVMTARGPSHGSCVRRWFLIVGPPRARSTGSVTLGTYPKGRHVAAVDSNCPSDIRCFMNTPARAMFAGIIDRRPGSKANPRRLISKTLIDFIWEFDASDRPPRAWHTRC